MNSWKTLAWPMFSMNSCEKTMENIGLANVFHEFVVFQRISWDQPGIYEKPKIHGKHWPGQCFPLFFHGNSWKTLAWPMFSMNLRFSKESPGTSQESRKNHEFMENIGPANVFHCFCMGIHGKHWPGQCFP